MLYVASPRFWNNFISHLTVCYIFTIQQERLHAEMKKDKTFVENSSIQYKKLRQLQGCVSSKLLKILYLQTHILAFNFGSHLGLKSQYSSSCANSNAAGVHANAMVLVWYRVYL